MDVSSLAGKVVVVTGAASGIGRATAVSVARRSADVAICDVDEEGLKRTAVEIESLGRRVLHSRVDVGSSDEMRAFADEVFATFERVDIVVNNAGIGVGGLFVDVPLAEWDAILDVNLKGVVHGCYFFVPRMIEAGRGGHVANVASMAGFVQAPGMSAYCTTKFGVVGLSESLRAEVAQHGIGVTAVCPGIINTPIVRSSRMNGPGATPENLERGARIFERRNYGPERVAEGILRAIQRNRAVAPVSPEAWAGYWMKRLFPWAIAALSRWGLRRQQRDA